MSLNASVSLKRNLVVHISARSAHAARRRRLGRRRGRAAIAARVVGGKIAAARTATSSVKQRELVIFNENLCRIAEQYLKKGSKVFTNGRINPARTAIRPKWCCRASAATRCHSVFSLRSPVALSRQLMRVCNCPSMLRGRRPGRW